MNFEQAKNLREDLLNMVGKKHNNLTIRDVVITPLDGEDFKNWVISYHDTKDAYTSILPYSGSDLIVEFIYLFNGQGYEHNGCFFHGNVLGEAKEKFGLEIDLNKYKN